MDTYYRRTNETPVYIAALILHPSRKWNYIEDNWQHHPDWILEAKTAIQAFWDSSYKPTESIDRLEISKAPRASENINRFKA